MNRTNVEHAFLAVLMQLALALLGAGLLGGGLFALGFFLAREHAQFEYKLVKLGEAAHVGDLNPLSGFAFWRWSVDSRLDFIFPAVAVTAVWLIAPAVSVVLALLGY